MPRVWKCNINGVLIQAGEPCLCKGMHSYLKDTCLYIVKVLTHIF